LTRITRHSASATLEMLPDGVLVVRLCGPLTGEALLYFKEQIVRLHGPDIRAFVADYRAAIIAMNGAELDAVLEGEPDGSAPSMPAALVVAESSVDLFTSHCVRMAHVGIARRAFISIAPALAWSRRMTVPRLY
jgi:hypothetical protein